MRMEIVFHVFNLLRSLFRAAQADLHQGWPL